MGEAQGLPSWCRTYSGGRAGSGQDSNSDAEEAYDHENEGTGADSDKGTDFEPSTLAGTTPRVPT